MHESTHPDPHPQPHPERPTPTRRRALVGAAALAALLGAGGVVAASQFASAARPTVVADTPDDAPDGPAATDGDAPWIEFDRCVDDVFGSTLDEVDDERSDVAEQECVDLLPLDIQEDFAAFDAFEQCIDEQLGDELGDELSDDGPWHGAVIVESVGPDGDDLLSIHDFGDGDATVTITKAGGGITVEASGDVTTFDEPDFDAKDAMWDDAEATCADLLPAEFGEFEDCDESVDDELDGAVGTED